MSRTIPGAADFTVSRTRDDKGNSIIAAECGNSKATVYQSLDDGRLIVDVDEDDVPVSVAVNDTYVHGGPVQEQVEDMIEVAMLTPLVGSFRDWLESRGLTLDRTPEAITGKQAIPHYSIGISNELWNRTRGN